MWPECAGRPKDPARGSERSIRPRTSHTEAGANIAFGGGRPTTHTGRPDQMWKEKSKSPE